MSFVLLLAVTGIASADQITITIDNPSFEDPVLAEDDYTWGGDVPVPGWTLVGGATDIEGSGVWNVTSADFDPVLAPEGENVLYTEYLPEGIAKGVAQVLTETFAANTDYTLTVEVGNSYYYYFSGYSVQLLAGGVVIAEDNDTLWPVYYKWDTSTVEYTYNPADAALVGQPLEIRLLTLELDKDNPPAGEVVGVEFDNVTLSYGFDPVLASNPNPADEQTDVPRDVILSWRPGVSASAINGHKVFFSENFGDVNDGVDGITLSASSYDLGRLEFGTTYYWRVDEISPPPNSTVYPGKVWSFTTELLAYPIENVTATASSSNVNEEAGNTVNGSGVDANDLHSTEATNMWRSSPDGDGPAWIEYEFDKVSKLHEMWVWNHNSSLEQIYGFGFKDVSIEYSADGIDYKALGTTHEFAQAPGTPGYAHETTIDFDRAAAKYVRLTANSTWGSGALGGLSEVRFFRIPVHARKPDPDSGATDVDPDVVLGWEAGREAVSHNVYVGTDPNALTLAGPVTEPAFDTASLGLKLGQDYHWRIDEVNDAETTTTWQGDIWNFTTVEYLVVDDFESYNDTPSGEEGSNLVYETWADGFNNLAANGLTIGYTEMYQPSMETSIVYGDGKQSVPLFYDNTVAGYSEVSVNTDVLGIGRNWTKGSPTTMMLWFYGDPNNAVTEQLYVKIGGTRVDYPGDPAELARPRWNQWPIDLTGMDLSNVPSLAVGFERTGAIGGAGMVYLDEIYLDRSAP